jgi:hypothetical protein
MHGLDVAGTSSLIVQRLPQLLDARSQRGITHHRIGPHRPEKLLFAYHLARLLD